MYTASPQLPYWNKANKSLKARFRGNEQFDLSCANPIVRVDNKGQRLKLIISSVVSDIDDNDNTDKIVTTAISHLDNWQI